MKALILAAGEGSRLRPLSVNRPKPMFNICGKPILEHIIDLLKSVGITDLVVVVGYQKESIIDYFGSGFDFEVDIKYIVQENQIGIEDAILKSENELKDETYFLLAHADFFVDKEMVQRTIDTFNEFNADSTIALTLAPDVSRYGVAALDVSDGRIEQIIEKPVPGSELSKYAVSSLYMFRPEIFKLLKENQQLDLAINQLCKRGNVYAAIWEGQWIDVEYPWDTLTAAQFVMDRLMKEGSYISKDAEIDGKVEGPVWISDGVKIRPGAVIKGPVYIGKDTFIGDNSLIRDHTAIESNVVIGFGVEIKNSVILGSSFINRLSFIGDSVIANNVYIGAGTHIINYSAGETIYALVNGDKIDTGRTKLGAIIGDQTTLEVNCSIMPGRKIGNKVWVGPGVVIDKDIAPNKRVFVNQAIQETDM
ncbi:bifunctional sugar-1-phosphate nucleotidylyltransferase/acetyltransferase [Candidatus Borrarchaeum sp.]|uniref:bifunctional sugar-1-phosphate nucleotidylyltransferase/acetyltransferase n=1 Tax=Candidatus Borrarchaeum sp. TaxID=2846742 RepID=UPI00257A85C0|nr:bifunctional sugar-1-phosphate nucleotidylyltransferase/acetyltransferase [Candidatus Borrarchaeum sp.]